MLVRMVTFSFIVAALIACGSTDTHPPATTSEVTTSATTTSTTPPACGCTVSDPGCTSPSYGCSAAGFLGGGCADGQWCAPCGDTGAQCRPRAKPGEPCDIAVNVSCVEGSACNASGVCSGGDAPEVLCFLNADCPAALAPPNSCQTVHCDPTGEKTAGNSPVKGCYLLTDPSCIHVCDGRWKDCNGNTADGSETDLWMADNCGGCGKSCSTPNHCGPGCAPADPFWCHVSFDPCVDGGAQ